MASGGTRRVWLGCLAVLAGLGLLGALSLIRQQPAPRAAPYGRAVEVLRAETPRVEPATLGGMTRALSALEQDLTVWHRLVAPPFAINTRRMSAEPMAPPASAMAQPTSHAVPSAFPATPQEDAADSPARLALTMLAVMLAAVTLVSGLAALLLDRLLLAPFRLLRAAAAPTSVAVEGGPAGASVEVAALRDAAEQAAATVPGRAGRPKVSASSEAG
jgi:hypothetical protein